MGDREPAIEPSVKVNLKIPIDIPSIMEKVKQSCFGKMWDITTKECGSCADRDTCGIIMRTTVEAKAQQIADEKGIIFLDESDFSKVTEKEIKDFVQSGVTTVTELLEFIGKTANTIDDVAMLEFAKRFIKGNEFIYTKEGLVWLR